MTFYFILVLLFSLMYGVLGLGNLRHLGAFSMKFNMQKDPSLPPIYSPDTPGIEYEQIGLFLGNIMATIRISMGDFAAIDAADFLTKEENYLFWFIWLLTAILTCIIFLNFIVAEASASYT